MLSVDTETTGVDFWHGARPFFVTTCNEQGELSHWEWDVDPLTREPTIPEDDLFAIRKLLENEQGELVLQNAKFDVHALRTIASGIANKWRWQDTRDTLLAAHLLTSNQPKDLTTLAMFYLGVDIEPYEKDLEQAVQEARRLARSEYPTWRIAKEGDPSMPSAKEKTWKYDTWLPRAIALNRGLDTDHPWWTVLRDYSNADSAATVMLYPAMLAKIRARGLEEIYMERLKLLPIAYAMEDNGVTISKERLDKQRQEYSDQSKRDAATCLAIAKKRGHDLTLPKAGLNNSLKSFLLEGLKLPVLKYSGKNQTGGPCFDNSVMQEYEATLPEGSDSLEFIHALRSKRKRDTAVSYMEGYQSFWLPLKNGDGWYRMHPSLNPTGTDTLRWSSSNPNQQNISKQPGFNLRYMFGPAPGREWWSLDAKNIELRLPAYEAGETEMIALFERPDDPPYYGSNHLLVCDILYPREFAECVKRGESFKDHYKATLYQWVKNGNFAVQYGAMESSGTADRAYHMSGAQAKVQARFGNIKKLNEKMIAFAEKHGYVETMPDKTVNPKRGYPLMVTRTEYGRILPTVPLNYHIQGSAMWWMGKAIVRTHEYLTEYNRSSKAKAFIALQVHDELVLDFPRNVRPGPGGKPVYGNLAHIRRIQELMSKGGDDIGVPTPVSCEIHLDNWSEGVTL